MIFLLGLIALFPQETELFEEDITFSKTFIAPEVFYELSNNPLDINSTRYEDFLLIPYLTPVVVKAIVEYRKTNGRFRNVNDLLQIDVIDQTLYDKICPFLTINKTESVKKRVELRTRTKSDSLAKSIEPKDWVFSNRIKTTLGNFGLVALTDKDALESNLFDFYGVSVFYAHDQNRLILGNYLLTFGQGLVFSQPYYNFLTGKSIRGLEPKELNPLTSPLENNSLFGITYGRILGNFSVIGYLSANSLDAKIDSLGLIEKVVYDGKHIDSASLALKDKLQENLLGARVEYSKLALKFGISGYRNYYNHAFTPRDSSNSFFGNQLTLLGIYCSGVLGNYYLYSELAHSLGNGFGIVCGMVGDWKPLKVSLSFFGNQKNFYSPHSRSYSLTNKKDNLSGNFNLRYDFYQFQVFLSGRTKTDFVTDSLPGKIEIGIERKESKLHIGLSHKRYLKDDISKTQGTKLDLRYDFSKDFNLGFRFEDRQSLVGTGRGILLRLSGDYSWRNFSYMGRIYWFEVTSSGGKIYAYEPGSIGLGGNQSFSGKGIRGHSFLSYNLKTIKTGLKIGLTKQDKVIFDLGTQIEIRV